MKKPLTNALKVFFGIGDFGFSLMTAIEMMAFTYFLTNIAQFSLATSTMILLVTSTIDAVLSPFYGAVISGMKAMRWGRYRSWLLIAPPLTVVFYAFQFSKIGTELTAAIIICAGFVLSHIFWNLAWVANISMITVLAKDESERGLLSSRRMTWTSASNFFTSYTSIPLALLFGSLVNSPVLGFTMVAGLMALLMMVGFYVHFVLTKGYEETSIRELEGTAGQTSKNYSEKATVGIMLKNLLQNPSLLVLLVADTAKNLVIFMYFAMLVYHYQYVLQRLDMIAVHILIGSATTTVGAYLGAFFFKTFSARTTVIGSMVVAVVAFLSGWFFAYDLFPFIASMALFMFVIGIVYAGFVTLYADAAIYGHWKTTSDATGFIMGLQNLPIKIAVIIRTAIISALLAFGGFTAGMAEATESLQGAIALGITIVPAISLCISLILVVFGFRLKRDAVAKMQEEIALLSIGQG